MSKPTYRVIIPNTQDALLELANNIIDKHTADNEASPLQIMEMSFLYGHP